MTAGERIKEARKSAGMTQAELAKKLGISYVGISQWENDLRKPKIETLQRIASALDVDINWLMNGQTLEQRDQAMKDYVARRFEASADLRMSATARKSKLDQAFGKLNEDGQSVAVERVEELTEIPKFQKPKDPPESR